MIHENNESNVKKERIVYWINILCKKNKISFVLWSKEILSRADSFKFYFIIIYSISFDFIALKEI